MHNTQLDVLYGIRESLLLGSKTCLVSVVKTWGTSPRPVGALLAINSQRQVYGSVSGGCIEEDLIERLLEAFPEKPRIEIYGETEEDRHRFGLPCGGTIQLVVEPVANPQDIEVLIQSIESRRLVSRTLHLSNGESSIHATDLSAAPELNGNVWTNIFGPQYQIIIIGAGQTSEYLAEMALLLDYRVQVCDPRPEYNQKWNLEGTNIHTQYPDDAIREIGLDQRTAVVALTHDPKLDDLALLESLGSSAFYVGALGSLTTSANRRERLKKQFKLEDDVLGKLHGPVGIPIGSKTPPEIALSVLAQITAEKNRRGK